jgi:hypothetical protein
MFFLHSIAAREIKRMLHANNITKDDHQEEVIPVILLSQV